MNSLISIVELPTVDFHRAVSFYQRLLDIAIDEIDMQGTQMGLFPAVEGEVAVALIKGEGYIATAEGTLVYFNGGKDLQRVLDKVEPNGGKVLLGKTEISPENGFFALFMDTEGNRLGLHSVN